MPEDGRDNAALIVAGLALMWLGALIESHSLAVASLLACSVAAVGVVWFALR